MLSTRAFQDASIIFSETPRVPHEELPSFVSMITLVIAPVAFSGLSILTL